MSGTLFVVSTPIGNLGDLSPRAREALEQAAVVCCEDTRHTGGLLSKLGLRAQRLLSVHEHNEASRTDEILAILAAGQNVVVVSDAGTPLVSDPGGRLVAAAIEAEVEVCVIPGASAVLAALVLSGFGADQFSFEGFLPRKGRDRVIRLDRAATELRPTVIYEAPSRILATLDNLVGVCGPTRRVAVCRELTKMHEEVWRGQLGDACDAIGSPRGEYVIVLEPATERDATVVEVQEAIESRLGTGMSNRDIAREVADETGWARRAVYERVIRLTRT
ncbi:MAG: 16S rRNA (cytidine(1402)-2'-O)-methyltransferase [Acidimicrobiales bacterium]